MDNLSKRLDQIDSKLDKLSDAVSRLAMIEERITHQTTGLNRQNERLDGHEKRLRQLEFQSSTRGVVLSYIERFGWLLLTASIGLLSYFLRG
ncbi:hypothetical protein [Endozoicomonas sp. Mp262]|uniref:hypothetical protein n=1 Tax=Endozoicomonas sp. Mp262 TaxID=2919499 RepID=UPI0021E0796A